MSVGNQAYQRSINVALVMRALRETSPVSRTEIAEATGLTKSTVSNLVRELAGRGLVVELPAPSSGARGGRPRVGLELRGEGIDVAGFDLRPDGVRVVVRGLTGEVRSRREAEAEADRLTIADAWALAWGLVAGDDGTGALLGIGVALPATVDSDAGVVLHSRSFGVLAQPVSLLLPSGEHPPYLIENDANALAWGALDSAPSSDRFESLIAVIGRSEPSGERMRVGTGIVIDGRVYHGRSNEAGEFRSVRWRSGTEHELERTGSAGLAELFESLAVPVSMLRPDRLVYGGDLAGHERAIRDLLDRRLSGSYIDPVVSGCPVDPAAEGPYAVAAGAARMYVERLFAVPTIDQARPEGLPRWEELSLGPVLA